jgi:UDP-N-acetylmuramoyl-tripeptide--D-alanyl-D-alanine ligase
MVERPLWTVQELLAATGGHLEGEITHPINGISIDSRSIAEGDVFVAIKGEKQDGHDYVPAALNTGAAVAIVSKPTPEMLAAGPVLTVRDDPLRGLEAMGRAARNWNHGKSIAVTGSVGKTSTKEMLRVALSASGQTHASAASFNNHWGVPLTLARFPRNAAFGVFEIGMNHAGEITPLVDMVKPHIAIITTIAESHLGHFKSLDEIADAKAEIFSGLVSDGIAIINRDTPYYDRLAKSARDQGVSHIVSFGAHEKSDVRMERVALHPTCCCITANVMGEPVVFKLGVPGRHMALNSLAVLAAVKLAGADLARAALALAEAAPAKGRGVQERLRGSAGEILLIDESYNANPASVSAALGLLAQAKPGKSGRKIAALGDMLELGEFGPGLHAGLAKDIDEQLLDRLYAAGPLMAHLWAAVPPSRRGFHAENSAELATRIVADLRDGDVIMVKGSLGSKMALVIDAIKNNFKPVAGGN